MNRRAPLIGSALVGVAALALGASVAVAESAPDQEIQYGVCVSCHGAHGEGRPELNGPRIGDLDAAYVAAQLRAYRDGQHASDAISQPMIAVAQGLDDAQIEQLSSFISGLDPEVRSPGPAVEGGEAAYATCVACHGEDARGNAQMGAPDLLFQDSAYLARQLQRYRDGQRGGVMVGFVQGWSDEQIQLTVDHIASLRPEREAAVVPEPTLSEEEGLAAFADIYAVSTSPRCMNCHPAGDVPLQGDDSQPHSMGVTRFSPNEGLHCSTCHAAEPSGDGLAPLPPADAIWSMAPAAMVFQDRSPAELCSQLLDPEINGGRGPVELTSHVAEDHLLITSWHSGRTPPPLSHEELVARFETWTAAGTPCPEP